MPRQVLQVGSRPSNILSERTRKIWNPPRKPEHLFWPRPFLTERKISLACCARWTINSVKNTCEISSDFEGRVRMSSGKKSEAKTGQNVFNRQADRQTNRQADRQTDIYANRHDTRARSTIRIHSDQASTYVQSTTRAEWLFFGSVTRAE